MEYQEDSKPLSRNRWDTQTFQPRAVGFGTTELGEVDVRTTVWSSLEDTRATSISSTLNLLPWMVWIISIWKIDKQLFPFHWHSAQGEYPIYSESSITHVNAAAHRSSKNRTTSITSYSFSSEEGITPTTWPWSVEIRVTTSLLEQFGTSRCPLQNKCRYYIDKGVLQLPDAILDNG